MRLQRSAIAPVALFVLAVIAFPISTAQAQTPALEGDYRYLEAESDAIGEAIEAAIARMNFITRPIARGRLTRTNEPYQRVSIRLGTDEVTVTMDDREPIVARPDGNPMKWTREDGEVLDLTTRWVNGALEQTFVAEDGQRANRFVLSPGGDRMELHVTVTSPRLAQPLTYVLRYARE